MDNEEPLPTPHPRSEKTLWRCGHARPRDARRPTSATIFCLYSFREEAGGEGVDEPSLSRRLVCSIAFATDRHPTTTTNANP